MFNTVSSFIDKRIIHTYIYYLCFFCLFKCVVYELNNNKKRSNIKYNMNKVVPRTHQTLPPILFLIFFCFVSFRPYCTYTHILSIYILRFSITITITSFYFVDDNFYICKLFFIFFRVI